MAKELAATYPQAVAKLTDLFLRIEECDRDCSRINGSAPYGEDRRLRNVELEARGLDGFTGTNPSILSNPSIQDRLQLPDWEHSERRAWPPYHATTLKRFPRYPV